MLRGNSPAKVDDKGRIKVPTIFRKHIEEKFGRDFFVTSLNGDFVRVYPMPVWMEIEKKLDGSPSMNPSIMRFRNLVSYYGQEASMDDQGRLLIHPLLRKTSGIDGEVSVLGNQRWLDIWNHEKLRAALKTQPLTDDDRQVLSSLGI